MPKQKNIVIGLGNVFMRDEGIGVHIVRELIARFNGKYPYIDFVDIGTAYISILHIISGKRKAVVIDCARMGEKPGTIKRFTPKDVVSKKQISSLSVHENDFMAVLNLSRKLGEYPEEVVIFGIEPEKVEPGETLSVVLRKHFKDYIKVITAELTTII